VKISLGTWRFFLAFLVAISHLWAGMIDGPAAYAVWGFFVLSGYLMTLVLMTK
jgi:peptidoglycan/LPS O-acetylase OafA/YrhL